jgi:cysteine-S-conjugate beta-lyase
MIGVNPLTQFDLATLRRRRSMKWRKYPDDVLPLWVAEMDTPLAPPVTAALEQAIALGDTGYATPGQLFEAFAGFANHRFGWWPDPAQCALAGDVAQGIADVLRVVTEPGDVVLISGPTYPPFRRLIPYTGRILRENPMARGTDGRFRLDLDRLAHDLAAPEVRAYLLVNPHNPSGTVLTPAELATVATLCASSGVRLLADEIHAPLVFPSDGTFVPLLSLPEAQHAISFMSASKAWNLAGLKTALIIAGSEAVADVRAIPADSEIAAGLLGVVASEAAFRAGGRWLDDLLAGLDHNRTLLDSLLTKHLPEVGCPPPAATFLAWLDCSALALGADPAAHFLEHGRVALSPGPEFGPLGRGFVRLNFATSPEILTEGVLRMAAAASR